MKVKVGEAIHDTDKEAVLFVFSNNDELIDHIKNLVDMLNHPNGGIRKIVCFPDDMPFAIGKKLMDEYTENKEEGNANDAGATVQGT